MMNFANPHAILIKEETLDEIQRTTYMSTEALKELIHDSRLQDMRFYVVGYRDFNSGWPKVDVLTEVEFACEYRLKTVNQFWNHFTKI